MDPGRGFERDGRARRRSAQALNGVDALSILATGEARRPPHFSARPGWSARDNEQTEQTIRPATLSEPSLRDWERRFVIRRIERPSEIANPVQGSRRSWVNILFLSLTPVIGIVGTAAYAIAFGVRWWEPALFVVLFGLVSFSVTAGYHRCFAHKAYVCHPAVQVFYLFFGAMALQNSALKWSSDHRDHHRYVDRDWDPYGIQRGGLWAHILWLFYTEPPERTYDNVPDLQANRLVRWQFRFNGAIGIIAGLGIPTLIGAFFGRPVGGLLWGGFLRIALIHHTTFLVNSVAHLYGTRPYTEASSARDNALLSLVTNGEGYHNFHHKFPSDFRNGVRWYQWDPTKWLIELLGMTGLARDLKRTPESVIEKTRLRIRAETEERRRHSEVAIHATARSPIAGPPEGGMHAAQ
jgi:stearoyl-CoA desaturase (Delta-9 desaturase)